MAISVVAVKVSNTQSEILNLWVICWSFGAGHFSWVMGGAGSLIQVYKAGEMNTRTNSHTQSCTALQARTRGVSETQTLTYTQMCMQCQSCSLALQLSGQVFLLQHISNMSRSHTHAHTQTPRHAQISDDGNLFCQLPLRHVCVHSNQESRHSGTQKPRQLLVSTGKCLSVNFFCFVYDTNVSAACI